MVVSHCFFPWMQGEFMKRRTLILAIAACCALAADKESDELKQFRVFIQEHPRALEELKADPSLIGKPEFAKEHDVVGEYLSKHPTIKDQVKAFPHFFDNLTPTRKGGEHRNHPEEKKN